jgi:hypothetical protein
MFLHVPSSVDLPAQIKHRSAKSELGDDSLTDEASTTDTDSTERRLVDTPLVKVTSG